MQILFEVTDPRAIIITCSQEQWEEHVLQHKPFMSRYLESVKETLRNPDFISQDVLHKKRNCYYSRKFKRAYIKVIVALKSNQKAELITAYIDDGGKKGEELLWP